MPSLAMLGVLPTIVLAFFAWGCYTAGLASLQHECDKNGARTRGLMGDFLPCSRSYRLPWFYMAFEVVILLLLASLVMGKKLRSARMAMVGLFAVATVLFIDIANRMLDGQSISHYSSGWPMHRIRTVAAGAILTALFNALLILAIGTKEHIADKHIRDKHHDGHHDAHGAHTTVTQPYTPATVTHPV